MGGMHVLQTALVAILFHLSDIELFLVLIIFCSAPFLKHLYLCKSFELCLIIWIFQFYAFCFEKSICVKCASLLLKLAQQFLHLYAYLRVIWNEMP